LRDSKKRVKGKASYSKRRSPASWIWAFLLFAAVVFAGYSLYCWKYIETVKPGDKKSREAGAENRMAIVIDDMGYDLLVLDEILEIDAPITVSVLPNLPHSVTVARKANKAGREVILHLPMEPDGYPEKRPGSGALFLRMDRGEIIDQLEKDIMDIPHISGVNDHMGSKFMEDEEKVEIVLDQLKKRGLFFLDSLTTKNSKGIQVARKIGLRHVGRDIFLDNNCDFKETLDILNRIAEKQNNWKTMVIIGHPHESTIQAIRKTLPVFRNRKIHIVSLSELVH